MSFSEEEIKEFKAEAFELLDLAEKSLLAIDSEETSFKPAFDNVFRGFHNLKGAAGVMELYHLQAHTHELENILMGFKEKDFIPKDYINLFLRGIDGARHILDGKEIQFDYSVPSADDSPGNELQDELPAEAVDEFIIECDEVIERISKYLQSVENGTGTAEGLDGLYRDIHSLKGSAYLFSLKKIGHVAHSMESYLDTVRNGTHTLPKPILDLFFKGLSIIEQLIQRFKSKSPNEDLDAEITTLVESMSRALENPSEHSEHQAEHQMEKPKQEPPPSEKQKAPVESEASSIRVPVALLDNLMTLMGEMVLVRNQVLQFSSQSEDLALLSMSKHLNVVTSEIQGEMMKTRMQPVGSVLNKFNRVVRDLAQELGKKIQLSLSGAETELDKSLLEAIKDPLTHMSATLAITALKALKCASPWENPRSAASASKLIMRAAKSSSKLKMTGKVWIKPSF